jgi:hypothetical protein
MLLQHNMSSPAMEAKAEQVVRTDPMPGKIKYELQTSINALPIEDHIAIFRILVKNSTKKSYTANNSGTFFELNTLDNLVLWKIESYVSQVTGKTPHTTTTNTSPKIVLDAPATNAGAAAVPAAAAATAAAASMTAAAAAAATPSMSDVGSGFISNNGLCFTEEELGTEYPDDGDGDDDNDGLEDDEEDEEDERIQDPELILKNGGREYVDDE